MAFFNAGFALRRRLLLMGRSGSVRSSASLQAVGSDSVTATEGSAGRSGGGDDGGVAVGSAGMSENIAPSLDGSSEVGVDVLEL